MRGGLGARLRRRGRGSEAAGFRAFGPSGPRARLPAVAAANGAARSSRARRDASRGGMRVAVAPSRLRPLWCRGWSPCIRTAAVCSMASALCHKRSRLFCPIFCKRAYGQAFCSDVRERSRCALRAARLGTQGHAARLGMQGHAARLGMRGSADAKGLRAPRGGRGEARRPTRPLPRVFDGFLRSCQGFRSRSFPVNRASSRYNRDAFVQDFGRRMWYGRRR